MKFEKVIPWGRSFDEYRRMFALSDSDLKTRILGCADGPASFNAEGAALGVNIVSCDPIYDCTAAEIEARIDECYDSVVSQLKASPDDFVWRQFRDPDDLGQQRLRTMRCFLQDFETGKTEQRYLCGSLPSLDFRDRQFDLALVSHLLFMYTDKLSYEFHLTSITELLRVAQEVRIFPLINLEGKLSVYLDPIRTQFESLGIETNVRCVDYEFFRADDHAGNRMLSLRGK